MTVKRRRACVLVPRHCRPCCRRLPKADLRDLIEPLTPAKPVGKQTRRRPPRLIATAVLIALSGALAGCGSTAGFDPSDLLDFLDTKKKLSGDRKPVFPEGVPGLEQGVPRDLYRGAGQ